MWSQSNYQWIQSSSRRFRTWLLRSVGMRSSLVSSKTWDRTKYISTIHYYIPYVFIQIISDQTSGRLASSRNSNHPDDSKPRDHQESACRHNLFRAQNVAAETEGYSRIGSRLLHVSNQHGSNEKPDRLFGCCGTTGYRWPNDQHRFGSGRGNECHACVFGHRITDADNHVATRGRRTDNQRSRRSG